jgi:hypothetical protein
LAKPPFDSLPKRTYTLSGEGNEGKVHGLPFSWDLEAVMQSRVILPQNEIIGRGYSTDALFGHDRGSCAISQLSTHQEIVISEKLDE